MSTTRTFKIKVGLALDLVTYQDVVLQEGASLETDILLAKQLATQALRESVAERLANKELDLDELGFDVCATTQLEAFQSTPSQYIRYIPLPAEGQEQDLDGDDGFDDDDEYDEPYVPMSQVNNQHTPPNGYVPYSQSTQSQNNLSEVLTRLSNLIQVLTQK